jgi:hypothetical protein
VQWLRDYTLGCIVAAMAILADLIGCFADKRENVGTEAFRVILKNSTITRKCFVRFCAQSGVHFPESLDFQSQSRIEDSGQPDMVGRSEEGRMLVIESKFDAGLTENQPVAYFEHLDVPGLLLFIVPEYRRRSVWFELCKRCRDKGLKIEFVPSVPWEFLAQVENHRMGLVSWRTTLSFLIDGAREQGDTEAAQDLAQLKALCDRMDQDAFMPFQPEELTDAGIPRRLIQLMTLSSKVVERAEGQRVCRAGPRTSGELYQGRFLWLGPLYAYLGCFLSFWKEHAVSPLWFQTGPDWKENVELPQAAKKHLKSILSPACIDPSKFPIEVGKNLWVPFMLKPGVEEDQLVSGLTEQIAQLRNTLFKSLSGP